MTKIPDRLLIKFGLFNFLLVAILGAIMRYKIVWSLPFLNQKHLQEAHSHFAFYGWVSSIIYLLMVHSAKEILPAKQLYRYKTIIILNFVASYGMLFSFLYGGYYWSSIFWSAIALFLSFGILSLWVKDYKHLQHPSKVWFLGGLFFASFSSLGVFSLAYMKAFGIIHQSLYWASTLFYLHFQYNGFFVLSCIGIILSTLPLQQKDSYKHSLIFGAFALSTLCSYTLSITWISNSKWLLGISLLGNIIQLLAIYGLACLIKKYLKISLKKYTSLEKITFSIVIISYFFKVILQQLSAIPEISQWVFGFRAIVIAYLHLILLVCISSFLLLQIITRYGFHQSKTTKIGLILYLVFVLLNELILAQIGLLSLVGMYWRWSPIMLWWISIAIVLAITLIFAGLKKKNKEEIYSSL
ncbi:hypothetical protein [Riemerella anatipestifer]|uniref:Uncharacterized protein n=1 Tax=Riemerella anatipestifer TaxID=34085 RepID=A0A1S7DTT5_RIEAN|nr:hypothetical protein [Riemerella anatipestifer]AQY22529.1 hypothetical protein AB406_1585 [Riemerella anatipestifer]MCO4304783.1 hypothetical protein [Riemerella anatipestifer]MCO7353683.1 hypothetical protein [Riemerella anatipestifer]MCQ4040138.1 hypothetical protein [Riemerella anatipestifer]MCT6761753.1 hypothetical protein [Riemerella anatipestifer]